MLTTPVPARPCRGISISGRIFPRSLASRLVAAAFGLAVLISASSARAGETQDLREFSQFAKQTAALEKTNPNQAVADYDNYLQSHPTIHPNVAVVLQCYKANIYAKGLNDSNSALGLLDKAAQTYSQPGPNQADAAALLRIDRAKADILIASQQWNDVATLLGPKWGQILAIGAADSTPTDTARMAHQYIWALQRTRTQSEAIDAMIEAFRSVPGFLDGEQQWPAGSLYDELVNNLIQAGRAPEALRWAKLQYVLCPYNTDALARAAQLLNRAWNAQTDPALKPQDAIAAFAAAQQDASMANPLINVPLPDLNTEALTAQAVQLQQTLSKKSFSREVPEFTYFVTLTLAMGQPDAAMRAAQALRDAQLQDHTDDTSGANETMRVFKAVDLSIVRATAFVNFRKGDGPDPLPGFYQQYESRR
jgi:hypothetical protein